MAVVTKPPVVQQQAAMSANSVDMAATNQSKQLDAVLKKDKRYDGKDASGKTDTSDARRENHVRGSLLDDIAFEAKEGGDKDGTLEQDEFAKLPADIKTRLGSGFGLSNLPKDTVRTAATSDKDIADAVTKYGDAAKPAIETILKGNDQLKIAQLKAGDLVFDGTKFVESNDVTETTAAKNKAFLENKENAEIAKKITDVKPALSDDAKKLVVTQLRADSNLLADINIGAKKITSKGIEKGTPAEMKQGQIKANANTVLDYATKLFLNAKDPLKPTKAESDAATVKAKAFIASDDDKTKSKGTLNNAIDRALLAEVNHPTAKGKLVVKDADGKGGYHLAKNPTEVKAALTLLGVPAATLAKWIPKDQVSNAKNDDRAARVLRSFLAQGLDTKKVDLTKYTADKAGFLHAPKTASTPTVTTADKAAIDGSVLRASLATLKPEQKNSVYNAITKLAGGPNKVESYLKGGSDGAARNNATKLTDALTQFYAVPANKGKLVNIKPDATKGFVVMGATTIPQPPAATHSNISAAESKTIHEVGLAFTKSTKQNLSALQSAALRKVLDSADGKTNLLKLATPAGQKALLDALTAFYNGTANDAKNVAGVTRAANGQLTFK